MTNQVCVLGPIRVMRDDRTEVDSGGMRQRRLLAALATRCGDVVSVDSLVDIVFDGNPSEAAEQTLQSYVSRLRRSLHDGADDETQSVIDRVGPGYVLRLGADDFDAEVFERLARAARDLADRGDHAGAVRTFDTALRRWNGRPYAEFADEPWALAESSRLVEIRSAAIEDRAESQLALGGHAEVIADLERFAHEEQTRERPRAQLMVALYRSGRQADALRVYQDYFSLMRDEMGLEPSRHLRELEQQIVAGNPALDTAPLGGTALRGYQLFEELGRGAFSVVHRGTQPSVGRDVAVKVIRAELANDAEFIRRFETEAHMVANLEHPHIVPLYDFWREPDNAYLVMRWLRGGTLRDRIDRGPLDLNEVATMVRQVGGALEAAHRRDIVHRDIKPANIFCDDQGNFYLGDFGIAVGDATTDDGSLPASVAPAYASPELLERGRAGPTADIYSLGVTVFEALTGRAPFSDSRSDEELIHRQLHEPIPLASSIREGVPIAVEEVLQRATAKSVMGRYGSAREFAAAFEVSVDTASGGSPRSVGPTAPALDPGPNPYKGLRAFQEADARDFFGRRPLVAELLDVLRREGPAGRLVTVVGASGSGKSSVVRAGLVPALREGALVGSEDWFVATVMPGSAPFAEVEAALLRIAVNPPVSLLEQLMSGPDGLGRAVKRVLPDEQSELLLVIDQFEELFTLVSDPSETAAFLDAVLAATDDPHSRVRVVLTLRADFYDRPLRDPRIADRVKASTVVVTPLTGEQLAEAVALPAQRAGAVFEDRLVARIATDVADQPGSLPLLQYSLAELYDRSSGTLTHHNYDELGGVVAALAGRAEAIYADLDPDVQEGARLLFTRLVTLGDDTEDTRRRVSRAEVGGDARIEAALTAFDASRLLTFDRDRETREPTVEVAHESLIREWPRFRAWIDDDRDGLRIHRHLTAAASAWTARGEDEAELYRGSRLDGARSWADTHVGELNELEQRFLAESTADAEREIARGVRHTRRLRRTVAAVAAVATVALVAGLLAVDQRRRADDARLDAEAQRDEAETAQSQADARRIEADDARINAEAQSAIATAAQGDLEEQAFTTLLGTLADKVVNDIGDPVLATLIGLEARTLRPDATALDIVAQGLLKIPGWMGSYRGSSLSIGADRTLWEEDGIISLRRDGDAPTAVGDEVARLEENVVSWALSPDAARVALVTAKGLSILDLTSFEVGPETTNRGQAARYGSQIIWSEDDVLLVGDRPIGVYLVNGLATEKTTTIAVPDFDPGDVYPLAMKLDPQRGVLAVSISAGAQGAVVETWQSSGLADGAPTVLKRDPLAGAVTNLVWGADGDLYASSAVTTAAWRLSDGSPEELAVGTPQERGLLGIVQPLSGGSIFVGGTRSSVVVDESGTVLREPWPNPGGWFVFAVTELSGERLAIHTIDISDLGTRTDIWSLAGENLVGTVLPEFSDLAGGDRSVQYFADAGIATVMEPHKSEAVNIHELDAQEIWDLSSDDPRLVSLEGSEAYTSLRLSLTNDGPVVAGLAGGAVTIHDARSGLVLARVPVSDPRQLVALYVSRDRRELTVFGDSITTYDIPAGAQIDVLDYSRGTAVWIVRDESAGVGYIANRGIETYDLRTLERLDSFPGGDRALPSPSRQLFVSTSGENLEILDAESGAVTRFANPRELAGRFDPTERYLVGWDPRQANGGVQFWDVATQTPIGPFVTGVVGDQHLVDGELAQVREGRVHIWNTDPESWLDVACDAVGRNLTQDEWNQFFADRPYTSTCPQYPPGT